MRALPATAIVAVLVALALAGCASGDGSGKDTDGDGLLDDQETGGWVATIDLIDRRVQRPVTSDPASRDTDGDGLEDVYEAALGSDPRVPDTDADGLTDCQEGLHSVLAQCEDPEFPGPTDGGTKTGIVRADSDPGASRYVVNVQGFTDETGTLVGGRPSWGDGIPDGQEMAGYDVELEGGRTVRVQTDPLQRDSDGDFLDDGEEALQFATDPQVQDTDGDGCQDGVDPVPGQEERFGLGLQSVTWSEPGASGQARLRFTLFVADSNVPGPGGENGLPVQHGQETDLLTMPTPDVRARQCSFTPYHPWVRMTLLVDRVDSAGRVKVLDLESQTNPDGTNDLWWNVQTQAFRWDPLQGPDQEAPLTWRGVDGTLVFHPRPTLQGT